LNLLIAMIKTYVLLILVMFLLDVPLPPLTVMIAMLVLLMDAVMRVVLTHILNATMMMPVPIILVII
jgi:hypothetical protein